MIIFISSYFQLISIYLQLISIYFQVKEKKQSPQEAAGHNSVPPNKPYYCVSWSFMFFFGWLKLILWKAFGFDSKKNEAK